jgi:predicted Zn finger-like uncharacterized protein
MSMHTRCTHCEAVFRVTLLQLQSSSGRVRCGVCHAVFDAFVHLRAAEPPPPDPVALPRIDVPEETSVPDDVEVEAQTFTDAEATDEPQTPIIDPDEPEAQDEWPAEPDSDAAASATQPLATDGFVIEEIGASAPPDGDSFTAAADDTPGEADGWPPPEEEEDDPPGPVPGTSGTGRSTDADTLVHPSAIHPPATGRPRWPLVTGVAAAVVVLVGQAAYQSRTAIATALPALRPALESVCAMAGCDVPLPRLPERLVIETSDLRALDPSRPNRVVLATTVRNSARVAQAYPMLELSLTDARDKLTARKVFDPTEYLDPPPAKGVGLGADAEFSVRMQLDVGDIEASGYRIYLFHR